MPYHQNMHSKERTTMYKIKIRGTAKNSVNHFFTDWKFNSIEDAMKVVDDYQLRRSKNVRIVYSNGKEILGQEWMEVLR